VLAIFNESVGGHVRFGAGIDCKHCDRLCEGTLLVAQQLTNMVTIRNIEVMCGMYNVYRICTVIHLFNHKNKIQ